MAVETSENRSSFEGTGGLSLSFRDIVITLYRRKWIILAIMLPISLAGGWALMNQSGSYWATARVLVGLTNVEQPRWNTGTRNVDYDRELSTLFNIAMSVSVAEIAAKSLEDSIPMIQSLDPMLLAIENVNDLTEFLIGSTNVSVIGESRILEFQVNAPQPRLALMGVGAMRDAFVQYQISGGKEKNAITYYEEQIEIVRSKVDSLLSMRAEILEEHGYTEMRDQLGTESGILIELRHELMQARSNLQEMELRYRQLSAAVEGDPRDFPMGLAENRSTSLINMERLVIKHEDALNNLLSIHKPNSIPVKQQQELFQASLDNLKREELAYLENMKIDLDGLRLKEDLLEEQVNVYEERQRKAPHATYKISMIDTETTSLRDVMKSLQGKLGEVRLSNQADERVSEITNLTNPQLSELISSGKSILYFLIMVFFALALGIVVAFVLEILDHRISNSDEITEHFQLPVFANIRKIN